MNKVNYNGTTVCVLIPLQLSENVSTTKMIIITVMEI